MYCGWSSTETNKHFDTSKRPPQKPRETRPVSRPPRSRPRKVKQSDAGREGENTRVLVWHELCWTKQFELNNLCIRVVQMSACVCVLNNCRLYMVIPLFYVLSTCYMNNYSKYHLACTAYMSIYTSYGVVIVLELLPQAQIWSLLACDVSLAMKVFAKKEHILAREGNSVWNRNKSSNKGVAKKKQGVFTDLGQTGIQFTGKPVRQFAPGWPFWFGLCIPYRWGIRYTLEIQPAQDVVLVSVTISRRCSIFCSCMSMSSSDGGGFNCVPKCCPPAPESESIKYHLILSWKQQLDIPKAKNTREIMTKSFT